ncbi:DUF2817 domain-containing protein [Chloroflexi bacterium TSY]|nr:DUF2817 domain-containing protein [Chloroflexi bacterium TSY]
MQLKAASTIVLVSHRPQVIRAADHILVLDDAQIAGEGTHNELLAQNATYQELFSAGFGETLSPSLITDRDVAPGLPESNENPLQVTNAPEPSTIGRKYHDRNMAAFSLVESAQLFLSGFTSEPHDRTNVRRIGFSEEGRPLLAEFVGSRHARLRVLLMGGQHGDEPLSSAAIEQFAREWKNDEERKFDVQLAIIPCLNPDGAVSNQRHNARGVDLNRDHQRLQSAEVLALHRFVRSWRPHLVIDTHTYPARRKHLLQHGLLYYHDVFLDVATHPAIVGVGADQLTNNAFIDQFLRPVLAKLSTYGISAERYTIINRRKKIQDEMKKTLQKQPNISEPQFQSMGRVRHSTPDIIDARNGLALRYGCMTVLIEGRQPYEKNAPSSQEQALHSMVTALRETVLWALENREQLQNEDLVGATSSFPSSYQYVSEGSYTMIFLDYHKRSPKKVTIPSKYTPRIKPTTWVDLPSAYAIPIENQELLYLLIRHGFEFKIPGRETVWVESYTTESYVPSHRTNRVVRKSQFKKDVVLQQLSGHWLFPTNQPGARALAALLEPGSKTGLSRYPEFGLTLAIGQPYPILRVIHVPTPDVADAHRAKDLNQIGIVTSSTVSAASGSSQRTCSACVSSQSS